MNNEFLDLSVLFERISGPAVNFERYQCRACGGYITEEATNTRDQLFERHCLDHLLQGDTLTEYFHPSGEYYEEEEPQNDSPEFDIGDSANYLGQDVVVKAFGRTKNIARIKYPNGSGMWVKLEELTHPETHIDQTVYTEWDELVSRIQNFLEWWGEIPPGELGELRIKHAYTGALKLLKQVCEHYDKTSTAQENVYHRAEPDETVLRPEDQETKESGDVFSSFDQDIDRFLHTRSEMIDQLQRIADSLESIAMNQH